MNGDDLQLEMKRKQTSVRFTKDSRSPWITNRWQNHHLLCLGLIFKRFIYHVRNYQSPDTRFFK
jgi:hypothetical protein